MGTPQFAVPVLESLMRDHHVLAVYARPDAASRRGRDLVAPPTKTIAEAQGIEVRQPATLRDTRVVADLAALAPDVVCVAAYGLLLPREVLEIPRFGCLNVHASLLPRYRGAAPIQRAILDDEKTTGVSIMLMEEGLDTGPYTTQVPVDVDDLSTADLTSRLADVGAAALLTALCDLQSGGVSWHAQDDAHATYALKVTRNDVVIDPTLSAAGALRRVRASSPSATTRVSIAGHDLVVLRASLSEMTVPAGLATPAKHGLVLGLADAAIALDEVRPAGRGAMSGTAFARGARLDGDVPWRSL